ncbi:kinetochore Sim4 complex subunit Fta4 [Staphylotrichum tortipilum]|uniref:Kinetochore Sim4 complex subunit Fta4 n=1 Tax=Staphylotrichum tortipilum TaxID=2831512 RepID=A0AAN6RSE1_9PEZI|nr:kinetochore Sim4 complex subunit Fta4 [Staphylotrichum longicolle]
MAPTPPTIVSLKQSFLTTQTRLLSQPLTPSRAWHASNTTPHQEDNANNTPLPPKAVDDALFKLNHRLHQHARRVYAPQATRHVAEQIDQLYWNAAEAATRGDEGEEEDGGGDGTAPGLNGELGEEAWLVVGADLTDPAVLATLPATWDSDTPDPSSLEERRYAELAGELQVLAEQRRAAAERVTRLRRMRGVLEPFSSPTSTSAPGDGATAEDVDGDVQENLVTRNGEVEAELQKMRMLLARVGGRVGRLKEGDGERESSVGSLFSERSGGGAGVEDVEMEERAKVGLLLERF